MLKIQTLDYILYQDEVTDICLQGPETLLDADILIVDPSRLLLIYKNKLKEDNNGVYCLYNTGESNRLISRYRDRRREILTLLEKGKIVIIIASPFCSFNGMVSERYNMASISNYDFLPIQIRRTIYKSLKRGEGTEINIIDPKADFIPYYKAFEDKINYKAYLDTISEVGMKLKVFLSNKSDKPVGFKFLFKRGQIVFLPNPSLEEDTDRKKFISVIESCCRKLLQASVATPPPKWITGYSLEGESILTEKILKIDEKTEKLEKDKEKLEEKKLDLSSYKNLLFEQGDLLEKAVINSLKILGFKAEKREVGDFDHDVVFESKEGKGIAEVEGKDKDCIHIKKLDQLSRVVDEDFHINGEYSTGVLIGNHYRLLKPEERKEPFSTKVQKSAERKLFKLLTTLELFKAIQYIFKNPKDKDFKKNCRIKILKQVGKEIKFIE